MDEPRAHRPCLLLLIFLSSAPLVAAPPRILLIMTDDNGGWDAATDNRPQRGGKGDVCEGGLRVPLILRWPAAIPAKAAGSVNATPVISMDLSATILEAAGADLAKSEPLDGVSLRPLLRGTPLKRDALHFHYPHYAWHQSNRPAGAIRAGDYKLIRRYDDDSVELYDMASDLSEKRDLAKEKPEVAEKLNRKLGAWLKEMGAQMPGRGKGRGDGA